MSYRSLLVAGCLAIPTLLGAQATEPSFQAVSIRKAPPAPCPPTVLCIGAPGPSTAPGALNYLPGGRMEVHNATLESLVRVAFGLEQFDRSAGIIDTGRLPSARVTRFDITAVSDREWTAVPAGQQIPAELRTMLRQLLEARFGLKTRMETKKVTVRAARLKAAEPGPGLVRASGGCLGPFTTPVSSGAIAPPAPCAFHADSFKIDAGSVTMPEVVSLLGRLAGMGTRVLVDETGLSGRWDIHLDMAQGAPRSGRGGNGDPEARSRDGIAKQLGLTIVDTSKPMATLVIEHAENPQED
jgi:uncharacterized protein (TIGR03435 family)